MVQGNRLLIYSQFTRTLDILQVWLAKRGWPFERLDGTVKSSERQARPAPRSPTAFPHLLHLGRCMKSHRSPLDHRSGGQGSWSVPRYTPLAVRYHAHVQCCTRPQEPSDLGESCDALEVRAATRWSRNVLHNLSNVIYMYI